MLSIGLSKVSERKSMDFKGNPILQMLRTKDGRIIWEKKNYPRLKEILERWQYAVYLYSKSQLFTEGLYEFIHSKKRFEKNSNSVRLSELLNFVERRFGTNTWNEVDTTDEIFLKKINHEILNGVKIDELRIFPLIYFPFMDIRYYNHSNWDKKPIGIVSSDILDYDESISILYRKEPQYSNTVEKNKCNNSGCKCNNNQSEINYNSENPFPVKRDMYKSLFSKPVLFVTYVDFTGYSGYIMDTRCNCQIQAPYGGDTTMSPQCKRDGSGKDCGAWTGDCSGGPCGGRASLNS